MSGKPVDKVKLLKIQGKTIYVVQRMKSQKSEKKKVLKEFTISKEHQLRVQERT